MHNSIETMERKAFRSFWGDGLLDLMLGLVLLVFGLAWWQDVAVLGAVFPAACVSMWRPLRRRLVEPRMGFVEFSGDRELKTRSFRFGLAGFFAGTAVLGMLIIALWKNAVLPQPAEWIAGFPLVLLALPAAGFALFTGCRRFYFYALLLLAAALELVIQGLEPHAGLLASGVVITLSGLFVLARFIMRHPAAREDDS